MLTHLSPTPPHHHAHTQELRSDKSPGAAYSLTWLGRLTDFIEGGAGMRGEQARRLLALMKDAAMGGSKSPQWAAAEVCTFLLNAL